MLSMRQIESVGLEEAPDHLCKAPSDPQNYLFLKERKGTIPLRLLFVYVVGKYSLTV